MLDSVSGFCKLPASCEQNKPRSGRGCCSSQSHGHPVRLWGRFSGTSKLIHLIKVNENCLGSRPLLPETSPSCRRPRASASASKRLQRWPIPVRPGGRMSDRSRRFIMHSGQAQRPHICWLCSGWASPPPSGCSRCLPPSLPARCRVFPPSHNMSEEQEPTEPPSTEQKPCRGFGSVASDLAKASSSTKTGSLTAASCQAGVDVENALQGLGTEDLRVLSRLHSGVWPHGGTCWRTMAGQPCMQPYGHGCAASLLLLTLSDQGGFLPAPCLLQPTTTSRPQCRRLHATRWSVRGAGGTSSCCREWACSPRRTSSLPL